MTREKVPNQNRSYTFLHGEVCVIHNIIAMSADLKEAVITFECEDGTIHHVYRTNVLHCTIKMLKDK